MPAACCGVARRLLKKTINLF